MVTSKGIFLEKKLNDELAIILFGSAKKIVKFLFGDSNLVKKNFFVRFSRNFLYKKCKRCRKNDHIQKTCANVYKKI